MVLNWVETALRKYWNIVDGWLVCTHENVGKGQPSIHDDAKKAKAYPCVVPVQWVAVKTHPLFHLICDLRLSRIILIICTKCQGVNDVTEVVTVLVVLQVRDKFVDTTGGVLEGFSGREVDVADDFVDTDAS